MALCRLPSLPSLHCPKQIQQLNVNDIDVNHSNHCPKDLDASLS